MSLLSSPPGWPERVYALLALAHEKSVDLDRALLEPAFNPGFWNGVRVQKSDAALVSNVFSAARSFSDLKSLPPGPYADWCDQVHAFLRDLPDDHLDAALLRTYAAVAVLSDMDGATTWFVTGKRDGVVDALREALGPTSDGQPAMNSSKLPAWERWMIALGLMSQVPLISRAGLLPLATPRMAREIRKMDLKRGVSLPAATFLGRLADKMPYLDGGRLFGEVSRRLGHTSRPRQLSPVMSLALQDLADRGVLDLSTVGDGGEVWRLRGDSGHRLTAFQFVTLREATDAAL